MSDVRYRFRGRLAPTARARTPIVAAKPDRDVTDGVAQMRLYDPIDSWGGEWGVSAKEFAAALDELGDVSEIHLHINSPGGEVWEGIAMMNALRNHPARVTAVVDGLAASAASFIASSADHVVMGRNTELMIHDAWGIAMGPAATMTDMAARLDKISDNIASVYAAKAGGTVPDWRALMLAETWYSAEEAVAAGLADQVEGAAQPSNAFDLSVFRHAGRADAPEPPLSATAPPPEPAAPPAPSETDDRRARMEQRRAARHARRAA